MAFNKTGSLPEGKPQWVDALAASTLPSVSVISNALLLGRFKPTRPRF